LTCLAAADGHLQERCNLIHAFSVSATIFLPGDRPLCISGRNEDCCALQARLEKLFVTKEVLSAPCTEVSFSNGTGPEKGTGRAPFSASVATATPGMCTTDDCGGTVVVACGTGIYRQRSEPAASKSREFGVTGTIRPRAKKNEKAKQRRARTHATSARQRRVHHLHQAGAGPVGVTGSERPGVPRLRMRATTYLPNGGVRSDQALRAS
jgi:hypothetical protein